MVITGIILVSLDPNYLREAWLHAKLLLVVILVALDLRVTFRARMLQAGTGEMSRRECMILHGAVSLVFLVILILVLTKPFGVHRRQAEMRRGNHTPAIGSIFNTGGMFGENHN